MQRNDGPSAVTRGWVRLKAAIALSAALVAACTTLEEPAAPATPGSSASTAPSDLAPLLDEIGPLHMPISTESADAQRYFDQALTFAFGFNHAEAVRSFEAAASLDATCGMCYWGVATALGPNINAPMGEDAVPKAWAAVQRALALRKFETPREQAYIDAVATRYSESGDDRTALDALYSSYMENLVARFPEDLHGRVLYAESLMDLSPWNYWHEDGSPRDGTAAFVDALEHVIKRDPSHPGALHLYIHAMEQYSPARAIAAADRLGPLVPVAGHLVHMPSHIYLRVGRYDDAVDANLSAAEADERYIAACNAQGFYPALYYPHNVHFLWYAAMMGGRQSLAVASARKLFAKVPMDAAREIGAIQGFLAVPAYTYVRFGMWDAALAEPQPGEDLPLARAMWHYAQGTAHAARGNTVAARDALAVLDALAEEQSLAAVVVRPGVPVAERLLDIARELVRARLARADGDSPSEIAALTQAVAHQDTLPYTEPPFWHFPVRQALGDALLRGGDSTTAARVFREDLEAFPNNGWSLQGLLRAEPNGADRAALEAQFQASWRMADTEPLLH